jgi:hypothetical protein
MDLPDNITIDNLDDLRIKDDDGNIIACLGMIVTLYVEDPHLKPKRLALAECVEEFLELAEPHFKWFAHPPKGGGKPRKFSRDKIPPIVDWVNPLEEDDSFEMVFTSSNKVREAGHYNFKCLFDAKIGISMDVGYVSATLPINELKNREPGYFQRMVQRWSDRISAYHGYAGLGIIQCMESGYAKSAQPILYPIIKRFPGLEYDSPMSHSLHCTNSIKGVNWLTVLSDKFLDQIGGKKELQSKLGEEFLFFDYNGGSIIQAGTHPQIGDLDNNINIQDYQKIYKLVKSIQSEYKSSMMRTPDGVDPHEFKDEWMKRFD